MKSKILTAVLSAVFVITAMGSLDAKTIKVGAAINLTGPASSWGQFHEKGQRDYFRYVNEVKGGIHGNKIEMITVDTAYKVPEAQAAVNKFILQDKVDMIATWGAGEGLAAKPIIQKYKIPTINYSTSWEILEPPVDYMYLPFGSYKMDCYAVLEYIKAIHKGKEPPKVGLLTYNNAYGRSIHAPSKEYAQKLGIHLVAVEEFPPKTVDLNTELLRLQKAGAEYIFMQMLPSAIITAFKSADRINYNPLFWEPGLRPIQISLKWERDLSVTDLLFSSPEACLPINQKELPSCRIYGNVTRRLINLMHLTGKALLLE